MARATPHERRDKAGAIAAKKMVAAADALHAYNMACLECGDHAAAHDRRHGMMVELGEMGRHLDHDARQTPVFRPGRIARVA